MARRHKYWKTHAGSRFSSAEMRRAQHRFRHHIRSNHNPTGRIHRERCPRHPDRVADAHHVDYRRPFLVAWGCTSCHRRWEKGTLKVGKKDLWDYESLVIQRPGGQKHTAITGRKRHA